MFLVGLKRIFLFYILYITPPVIYVHAGSVAERRGVFDLKRLSLWRHGLCWRRSRYIGLDPKIMLLMLIDNQFLRMDAERDVAARLVSVHILTWHWHFPHWACGKRHRVKICDKSRS